MIEIDTTDVYCFVFTDLRSYAGNKYDHFVKYNVINEIQFINFYHNVYSRGIILCIAPFRGWKCTSFNDFN